ncbi:hypothetical protein SS1G_02194 [Sclerotinia sclerotiorum 1980 UF-70]|uniref:FAD-binding domain-containing protein n=1 Tax=Sclerotinia sclerotiorum (strain ATCC 18683 / 1980 / Ss-1) TaxID=665079 RepID=A7EA62_SCLS1|nr:hypothetical protein SS1G_02194 [Sclerotinia sclerotiorum 1980 UF-70]EDN99340.1 hypothetical protein SS1G_02194 [Sclerotinia sclerotiorum 1980 UF-70]
MSIKTSTSTRKPHILISGASIAGPVLAYWLHRASIATTIVERSPFLRSSGQGIDIRGPARGVIARMGLDSAIRSRVTHELGLQFVDKNGYPRASFPMEPNGNSFTSDIEILRGDLSEVFYESTKETCEYVWDDYITGLEEMDEGVLVTFAKGKQRIFDLVVGADGLRSKTRRLAIPLPNDGMKSLNQYSTYFTIPKQSQDDGWGKWYNANRGRALLMRPDNIHHGTTTRIYLSITDPNKSSKLVNYLKMSPDEQKRAWREEMSDMGWEIERVLDGMDKAPDYYMQEIAQINPPQFYKGKIALVGDAGYCPSPLTGMGTSSAILGAYYLAGELGACDRNWEEGLKKYEEIMRPFMEGVQKLPPGVPGIITPQTEWGITALYGVLGVLSWTRVASLFGGWFAGSEKVDDSLESVTNRGLDCGSIIDAG